MAESWAGSATSLFALLLALSTLLFYVCLSRNAYFPRHFQVRLVIWSTIKTKFLFSMGIFTSVRTSCILLHWVSLWDVVSVSTSSSPDRSETYSILRTRLVKKELNNGLVSGWTVLCASLVSLLVTSLWTVGHNS